MSFTHSVNLQFRIESQIQLFKAAKMPRLVKQALKKGWREGGRKFGIEVARDRTREAIFPL